MPAEALVEQHSELIVKNGTNFMVNFNMKKAEAMKIHRVWFDETNIYLVLDSGHIIGNPLAWFKRLENATSEQLLRFELGPLGDSIHWEELDEYLSLESFFDFKRELNYAKI
ncbi:DUF2442 domain-containing protein [Dyadobacter sp. 676]|uniref:DUF2442 domain-containing protein n=1 Tax=Dyadobacter sp. 676 TaxID=3088362 RepID=A0AAU8FFM4_9BACT